MTTDVAVAHWAEQVNGGGERVAWELARQFDAPLYTSVRDEGIEPDDVDVHTVFDGWLHRLASREGVARMVANQYGWEIADPLRNYDVLITSGNEPLAYVPPPDQTWVHYVHHTSRLATDQLPYESDRHGRLTTVAARLVRKAERQLYSRYAQKPDVLVANSEAIQRRIQVYWGRDAKVAHPPVPVDEYSRHDAPTGNYYLVLSRLDWHKRIDEVVDTFADRDERLLIAGDGGERDDLEARATDNIEFLGYVSEVRKRELYSEAKAVINNALAEDFGLTTVEPMAAGTPVVGVDEGFTGHLIADGFRGLTYARGELDAAIDQFETRDWDGAAEQIEAFADRFNPERFGREMQSIVEQAIEDSEVTPTWPDP